MAFGDGQANDKAADHKKDIDPYAPEGVVQDNRADHLRKRLAANSPKMDPNHQKRGNGPQCLNVVHLRRRASRNDYLEFHGRSAGFCAFWKELKTLATADTRM